MDAATLSEGIDVASRSLAVLVAAIGLIVTVGQWTYPSLLKRREKWLREAIAGEGEEARTATLTDMLDETSSKIVAGLLVPGWRFLFLSALMIFGPVQAFVWARRDPDVWNVVGALVFALAITANPIRMGIRLLAERYRVAYEYREAKAAIQPPHLGSLGLNEGGTRSEFLYAFGAAVGLNAIGVGVALAVLGVPVGGLFLSLGGVGVTAVTGILIHGYAKRRVTIYGPWSVADPKM